MAAAAGQPVVGPGDPPAGLSAGPRGRVPLTKLQDLPDALLTQIAVGVDTLGRRTLMPVISKRWAGLLQGPGPAWEVVRISTEEEFPDETKADTAAIAAWFSRRAGSVRVLRVAGSVPKLPASLMATVLMSQAASLRILYLDVGAARISRADLGMLAALTALEALHIKLPHKLRVSGWDDHGAGVIGVLSRLPALTLLDYWSERATADVPTVNELAAFRSPSLTRMRWAMASTPEGTLALGALSGLKKCKLVWDCRDGDVLYVGSDSFGSATSLVKLCLGRHHEVHLVPGCLNSLGMLAYLSLKTCGLSEIPKALSGVRGTLRRLDLQDNAELQIDKYGFNTLMALRVLEVLDLREVDEPEESSQWTIQSTRFLVKFLSSWSERHPGAVVPVLKV